MLGGSSKTVTEMYQALKFEGIHIDEIHLIGTQKSSTIPKEFQEPMTPGTTWCEHRSDADDIRSTEQANKVADLIFTIVKTIKDRADVDRLFLDLTGGRKEMSSFLMLSAQLLCSEDDELCHVEVNDPKSPLWDKTSNYYYPEKKDEITLIKVPYVRLNNLFKFIGNTRQDSLQAFLESSRESLQRLCFCGLIANGIEHETNPLFIDAAENAPQIANILREIQGIFRQFHAVLRQEKISLKSISLTSVLDKIKTMMQNRIDVTIEIEPFSDVSINGDELLLLRVLTIILKNADKHGDATHIRIVVAEDENGIILRIIDNGKGMPDHICKEAFQLFKSYATDHGGKQVGLPVSKKLIELCQGNIEIEKSDEHGTIVMLRLQKGHKNGEKTNFDC